MPRKWKSGSVFLGQNQWPTGNGNAGSDLAFGKACQEIRVVYKTKGTLTLFP